MRGDVSSTPLRLHPVLRVCVTRDNPYINALSLSRVSETFIHTASFNELC